MMSSVRSVLPETLNQTVMYGVGVARCYIQPWINTEFNANALEAEPRILVGDLASASNRDAMKEQGITHVLCVLNGGMEQFPGEFEYKIIHANDDPWVEIDVFFDEGIKFIDAALTSGADAKVLVHCQRGASRSVTLVSAYLLYNLNRAEKIPENKVGETVIGVIDSIHNVRDVACPNPGFIEALKRFVCELNKYPYTAPEPEQTEETEQTEQQDEAEEKESSASATTNSGETGESDSSDTSDSGVTDSADSDSMPPLEDDVDVISNDLDAPDFDAPPPPPPPFDDVSPQNSGAFDDDTFDSDEE